MTQEQLMLAIFAAGASIATAIGLWVKQILALNAEDRKIQVTQEQNLVDNERKLQELLMRDANKLREYLDRELQESRLQIENINKTREALAAENASLEADAKQVPNLKKSLEIIQTRLDELENKYDALEIENKKLNEQINLRNLELAQKDKIILEKEIMINNLLKEIELLNAQLRLMREEINGLKQLVMSLQEEMDKK